MRPAYLKTAIIVEAGDLALIKQKIRWSLPAAHISAVGDQPIEAVVTGIQWEDAGLTCSQLRGRLLNASSQSDRQLTFASIVQGRATMCLNGKTFPVASGQSICYLPGDGAVQLVEDTTSFAVRILLGSDELIRMKALPFRQRVALRRRLSDAESVDLIRFIEFLCLEYDRRMELYGEAGAQVKVLQTALVSRCSEILESIAGKPAHADPVMLEICRTCDIAISEREGRAMQAEDLAYLANCSLRQLYRAFESVTGISPVEYQLRARLCRARALILDAAEERKEIPKLITHLGFPSFGRFASAYANEFGEAPNDTAIKRQQVLEEFHALGGA